MSGGRQNRKRCNGRGDAVRLPARGFFEGYEPASRGAPRAADRIRPIGRQSAKKRDEPQDRQQAATRLRLPGTENRRGGEKPRGRHLSRERHPGTRWWRHRRGPVPEGSRWRGVPTNPRRGGRRSAMVRHRGGAARAEQRLRRGGDGHGGCGRSGDRTSRLRCQGGEGQRPAPTAPQGTTMTGLPIGISVSRCSHRACPTDPRRPANLTEVARNVAQRASETTGNPLCSSNL